MLVYLEEKDSTLLLYCLSLYKKFARVKFDVVGVHIEMGFPNMDFSEVDNFCKKNNIELYHEPSDVYEILKLNKTDDGRLQCSLCSKFKKALVIDGAKNMVVIKLLLHIMVMMLLKHYL